MVTPQRSKGPRGPLFLKEHRKAKGVSALDMADHLGIERESVYRLERHAEKLKVETQISYAARLGIEPEALWRPPGAPSSLDAIVKTAPESVRIMAVDIVRRLVAG